MTWSLEDKEPKKLTATYLPTYLPTWKTLNTPTVNQTTSQTTPLTTTNYKHGLERQHARVLGTQPMDRRAQRKRRGPEGYDFGSGAGCQG